MIAAKAFPHVCFNDPPARWVFGHWANNNLMWSNDYPPSEFDVAQLAGGHRARPGGRVGGEAGAAAAGERAGAVSATSADIGGCIGLVGGRASSRIQWGTPASRSRRPPPRRSPGSSRGCTPENGGESVLTTRLVSVILSGECHSIAWSRPSLVRMYRRPLANTGVEWMGSPNASFQTSLPLKRSSAYRTPSRAPK